MNILQLQFPRQQFIGKKRDEKFINDTNLHGPVVCMKYGL